MNNTVAVKSLIKQLQALEKSSPGVELLALNADTKVANVGFALKKVYVSETGEVEILTEQMLRVHQDTLQYYTTHTDMQIWNAMSQDERLCYHNNFKELQTSNAKMRADLQKEIVKFEQAQSMVVMKIKN